MVSHKAILPEYDVEQTLDSLFLAAKAKDEFEYASTLLRLRGMEGPGWDPLSESNNLLNQTIAMIQSPIEDSFRLRLSLFLYCHATEMHDLYHIVGNMLRVMAGDRYSLAPFMANPDLGVRAAKYPAGKVERIAKWADEVAVPNVGELFNDMLISEIRNAFFHSDYILHADSFHIKHGSGVKIGNLIDPRVKLTWLVPRLKLGINVALALIGVTFRHIQSYHENKVVLGRLQGDLPVEVELTTAAGHGLIGFQSPPRRSGLATPSLNATIFLG